MKQTQTWNELLASLNDETVRLDEKGWNIYRYLVANVDKKDSAYIDKGKSANIDYDELAKEDDVRLSSEIARVLLLMYMKMPLGRPSLLHSMMLSIALKMTEIYPDFKLTGFLQMWDVGNLRREDYEQGHSGSGRTFHSLVERLGKCVARYQLTHPTEMFDEKTMTFLGKEMASLGFLSIMPMVAVKVFETMSGDRKMRFVKLIGPKGEELSADLHLFCTKPWEIVGRLYDVLPRRSVETGKVRVDNVVPSIRKIEEIFGQRIGYVDRYDELHKHYHIFDSDSGHYVAEMPQIRPVVGGYVWFCPIIPEKDKFKSAIVLRTENAAEAHQAFGFTSARVTLINKEKNYFLFQTSDDRKGLADLERSPRTLSVGDEVNLILFMKRYGKDREKRLYAADVI